MAPFDTIYGLYKEPDQSKMKNWNFANKGILFVVIFPFSLQIFDHIFRQETLSDQLLRQLLGRRLRRHRRRQTFERLRRDVRLLRRRDAAAAAMLPPLEFRLKF